MDKIRTEILIGKDNVQKIATKKVTIVGVGGVGGSVVLMLARAGIENFTLVDFDIVSSSNINRQVVAFEDTVGKSKVDVLKTIISHINPKANVVVFNERLSADNVEKIIKDTDIVVDAIDSVSNKIDLICYCKNKNIPIVSAMGAGNRFDYPKFEVMDIFKTHDDGLAKVLRKKLRLNGIANLDVVCSMTKPCHVENMVGSISYYPIACGCVITSFVINKIIKGEI